eukprot:Skav221529  [mRNA]  locus=scaffold1248:334164:338555:- [translate_table: standard]
MPGTPPIRQHWQLPRSWIHLQPDPQMIGQFFEPHSDDTSSALESWSYHVEQAVHAALKQAHQQSPAQQPYAGLPKSYRGRCKPVKLSKVPITPMIKHGRAGDYQPPVMQPTCEMIRLTRQIRRIQSLMRRLQHVADRPINDKTQLQLQQEWHCIRKGPGLDASFVTWIQDFPHMLPLPPLPTTDYLQQLLRVMQPALNTKCSDYLQQKKKHIEYLKQRDLKFQGKKQAFQQIREQGPGLMNHVTVTHEHQAELQQAPQHGLVQLRCSERPECKVGQECTIELFQQQPAPAVHALALEMATQLVRDQHREACQLLQEHNDVHVYHPLLYRTPWFELMRTLQFNHPAPELLEVPQVAQIIFTDGTCLLPTSKRFRWAAFAIVAPKVSEHIILENLHAPLTYHIAHHFEVLGVAHVKGRQTINRAELSAVVHTLEFDATRPVGTDSQYVLNCHKLILHSPNLSRLHQHDDWDLLCRWHTLIWTRGLVTHLIKIKAHQDWTQQPSDLQLLTLGNAVADSVVKTVSENMHRDYLDLMRQEHDSDQQARRFLQQQWSLRQDLAVMRKHLLDQQPEAVSFGPQAALKTFIQWTVPVFHTFSDIQDEQLYHVSKWGTVFTALLVEWLRTIRWISLDPGEHENTEESQSITWMELLFNFMLTTQTDVPHKWTTPSGTIAYATGAHDCVWTREQLTLNGAVFSLQGAVRHAENLFEQTWVPKNRGNLVASVYKLGATTFRKGFQQRPELLLQEETMRWISSYLELSIAEGKTNFDTLPIIPRRDAVVTTSVLPPVQNSWSDREAKYHQWQLTKRKKRLSGG